MTNDQLSPKQQEAKIAAKIQQKSLENALPSHDAVMQTLAQDDQAQESKQSSPDIEQAPKEAISTLSEKDFRASKHTDAEQEAMAKGWKPKESYQGPEDKWVSADEYLVRGKFIDQIETYRKDVNELKKSNKMLLEMIRKQAKNTSEDKADKLLKLKREAIASGDIEAAEEYENKYHQEIKEIDSIKELELKKQAQSTIEPEVQEFIERNGDWFNKNTPMNAAMYEYAVTHETDLRNRYPHWSTIRRLEETEKAVKLLFRDKFENPARDRASLVEATHPKPAANPNKITFNDLPPEVQQIVKSFKKVERPTKNGRRMSNDEYAQQLLEIGAIQL